MGDLIVSIPSLPVQAGQHQVADDIQLEPGGGANFLMAGARLGQPMAAIGALGDDEWGHRIAAMIQAEGIDLSLVRHEGTTTAVIVLVSQTGEHVFLGKYGHGSKIELGPPEVEVIKDSGAVYCAGYTLCEARLVNLALDALRLARQSNIPVYFDPGPQMADVPEPICHQILPLLDTVLATQEELPLLGVDTPFDLLKLGPKSVVVKHGPNGCTIYGHNRLLLEAPGYPVEVVDTSAAGDSFNAAFVVASLWGWPPADCARLANAVGAAKVQKLGGGRNVPTLAEVRAIIDEFQVDVTI